MTKGHTGLATFATRPRSRFVAPGWGIGRNPLLCAFTLATLTGGGDKFDCYAETTQAIVPGALKYGSGFSGAWVVETNYLGVEGGDNYEAYTAGSTVTGLNGPYGFSGAWVVPSNYLGYGNDADGNDSMETYTAAASIFGKNDGDGWSTAWQSNVVEGGNPNNAKIGSDDFESYTAGATGVAAAPSGKLNYASFTQWDVTSGAVDLIGYGFWDYLPGNGLYVDMAGYSGRGKLTTKTAKTLGTPTPSRTYLLNLAIAGNQRNQTSDVLRVTFGSFTVDITIPYLEINSAHQYSLDAFAPMTQFLSVELITSGDTYSGPLLTAVQIIERTTAGAVVTDTLLFNETWEQENNVTVSLPWGGAGWAGYWVVGGNDLGVRSEDTFESYAVGNFDSSANGGTGWNGSWSPAVNQH